MVGARGALDDDGGGIAGGKRVGEQRAAEPPAENEEGPFEEVFVLGDPQPYPGEWQSRWKMP